MYMKLMYTYLFVLLLLHHLSFSPLEPHGPHLWLTGKGYRALPRWRGLTLYHKIHLDRLTTSQRNPYIYGGPYFHKIPCLEVDSTRVGVQGLTTSHALELQPASNVIRKRASPGKTLRVFVMLKSDPRFGRCFTRRYLCECTSLTQETNKRSKSTHFSEDVTLEHKALRELLLGAFGRPPREPPRDILLKNLQGSLLGAERTLGFRAV